MLEIKDIRVSERIPDYIVLELPSDFRKTEPFIKGEFYSIVGWND
ncbi:MAG: hypothetical protein PHD46_02210 [Eubacteriales bacterium]|nr:hypothetical protein [Eubacteriales bacterium]